MTTSSAETKPKYRLQFHPKALGEWHALDGSVKKPLKQLLAKRLEDPHVPGSELHGDLAGCYKIKLRKQGVRLDYRVLGDALIVMVMAVDRREDGRVYRSAVGRITATVAPVAKAAKRNRSVSSNAP